MTCYYVYVLRDPRKDNQVFYVGKGKGTRCVVHLSETREKTENLHKWNKIQAIKASGLEVVVEKILENISEEDAYELEAALIKLWGRKGYDPDGILTNICVDRRPPSCLGRPVSEATKKKIGDAQRGELNHRYGVSWSDEEKDRRRQWAVQNGILPPDHTGAIRTDETRRKISERLKGKPKSPEHAEQCRTVNLGRKFGTPPVDRVGKIRASNVNAPSPNKRANWDDVREIRLMHRLGHKAKVIHERFSQMSLQTVRDIIAERTWKEEFRPRS